MLRMFTVRLLKENLQVCLNIIKLQNAIQVQTHKTLKLILLETQVS